jgi:hypothetical protein
VGMVTTNTLAATTAGAGMGLKFSPKEGTTFATFFVEGCKEAFKALEGEFKVTGSLIGAVDGATTTTTEVGVTEQNTLKLRNQKAGLSGTLTISGRDEKLFKEGKETAFTPLSATTTGEGP